MLTEKKLREFIAPLSKAKEKQDANISVPPSLDYKSFIPPHVTDELNKHQCLERFIKESELLGTSIRHATKHTLQEQIISMISECAYTNILIEANPLFSVQACEQAAQSHSYKVSIQQWDHTKGREYNIKCASEADVGITYAQYGIAETGTIIQTCSENCGRSISLLPTMHIACLYASNIVSNMTEALQKCADDAAQSGMMLPSQICCITGPSNTADIELVRVEGVHGPNQIGFIIIDD
ncbi:MAG: lactate utilization protein C [Eggerthellaceae bacterium]|jgi:L-lactate dehydrogenase complex protein LldG|nr:lactate utilization protein C [Eggerthellaceae bacterium]MCH4220623.1 lactate utilization protein C [Eggerthellaceae bacterium]